MLLCFDVAGVEPQVGEDGQAGPADEDYPVLGNSADEAVLDRGT
jgi:hypothetical protein